MDIKRNATIRSWDGTWTYHPGVFVTPTSVEDLVTILTDKERFPAPVRPAGSLHSTARMNGDDGGTMVDMRSMKRIIEITDEYARVEAGASNIEVTNALKARDLQFYITTEIGNSTLAALTSAATKDSSFPGEYGQIGSYATAFKLVTPQGQIVEINEKDNPQEMHMMRSSYGLAGIIFEVTIRVRPAEALWVRHYEMDLDTFRRRFEEWKRQDYAIMYYLFPYARKVVVELRRRNPGVKATARRIWQYRNRFWRKYGPAIALWIKRNIKGREAQARAFDLHFAILRKALVNIVRSDRALAWAQTINYPREPGPKKYLFSMWAFYEPGFFDTLAAYFDFCNAYYDKTGYRCDMPNVGYWIAQDRESLFSYCWDGPTLSIDPSGTGGEDWNTFLHAYNDFCSTHGGLPLFNQTPFLTPEMVRKVFGDRVDQFEAWRQAHDPEDRMLDSYFRELLAPAEMVSPARRTSG